MIAIDPPVRLLTFSLASKGPSTHAPTPLTPEQQRENQLLHDRRLRIEHVNSSVKRCRIAKDRIRLWKRGIRDLVMELCCGLHNFRVRLTPWQRMI